MNSHNTVIVVPMASGVATEALRAWRPRTRPFIRGYYVTARMHGGARPLKTTGLFSLVFILGSLKTLWT